MRREATRKGRSITPDSRRQVGIWVALEARICQILRDLAPGCVNAWDTPADMTFPDELRRIPMPLRLAIANVALAGLTFVTGILLARSLGTAGRGVYGSLFLWALTIANIFAWGAQITLARQAAQAPERAAVLYRCAYRMSAIGGWGGALVYLAVVLPATSGGSNYPVWLVIVASLIIPFSIPNAFQIQIELGRARFGSFNFVRGSFAVLNFLTIAVLWLANVRSVGVFVCVLVGTALAATTAAMLAIRRSLRGLPRTPVPTVAQTVRASTPIALTMLVSGLGQQSDKLLASAIFGPSVVGVYLVAATLAQIQSLVGEALAQMFFARGAAVTDLAQIDRAWLGLRLRQTVLIYAAICAVALVIVPKLVPVLYGAEFVGAVPLLYLLLPGMALQGMVRPFEEYLRGLNMPRILVMVSMVEIGLVGLGGVAAVVQREPMLLAGGTIAGFAAALLTAAIALGKRLGVSPWSLVRPRISDAIALIDTLVRRLRGHGSTASG